jgi:hypothetical protein
MEEVDSWREATVLTASGRQRYVTVREAVEQIWLDRNPGKKIEEAGENKVSALIEKYYLARKRKFSTDFKDDILLQIRLSSHNPRRS